MSIVAVHGPNTWGSKSIVANASGSAYAVVNPANGLIWTFSARDQSQVAANYDWAYTGLTGTPATPIPDTKNPVVTFSGAGTATVTLTLNGVAQQSFQIVAVAGVAPLMAPEEEAEVSRRAEDPASASRTPSGRDGDEDESALERNTRALQENTQAVEENTEAQLEFDPADYTVGEIEDYIRDNPEEAPAVLEAERRGKGRVTLMTFLESVVDAE